MYTAQKTRSRKWNDFLNRIERATQTHTHFIVCFEGWLYHMELFQRPPRPKLSQGTKDPNQAFWEMLNDRHSLGWKWYYDPEF